MTDPLLSLAFALHSNKGVFALLLGSGRSRAAQIPTGWEVVLDLIRKVAALDGSNAEPDPAAWYRAKFHHEPHYSEVLQSIAHTPIERQQLLKTYFEPTIEEAKNGIKM